MRSQTALIQTCGRAARNLHGRVIMYADRITESIKGAILITEERRALQTQYNIEHGITPRSTTRALVQDLAETFGEIVTTLQEKEPDLPARLTADEVEGRLKEYEIEMRRAAKELRFEDAAHFRDLIDHLKKLRMLE